VRIGTWLLSDSSIHRPLYDWPNPDGGYRGKHMGLLTLPAATLRDEDLLGWSAELRLTTASQESEAYQSLRTLLKSLRQGKAPDDSGRHVRAILDDLGGAADGLWQQVTGDPGADAQYELIIRSEQAPDPESRVTLGDEKDALGVPRIDLAWRVGDADVATIRRGLEILAAEVGRLGWGRVQIPEPEEDWSDKIHGGWHHMGTTRMADDPKRGVVDSDCRVHGLENLYVAGSSVFPTAGWANPTLTLVALAVRTAHHLKARLSEGAPPT
jgi:choline dehydrogenase-like flavoprotein